MSSRVARGVGAAMALVAIVVATPIALVLLVGNPWPGRTRVELGDELVIVVGVLAVLAWALWARFVLALVAEVRSQLDERARLAAGPGGGAERPRFDPPPARAGAGRLAQQLVAAVLVLLPVVGRVAPTPAAGLGPGPGAPVVAAPAERPAAPAPVAVGAVRSVVVAPGDTLIGIARAELGDADRWREIFDANRETVQPDGGRLTSPSLIRPGWTLVLPAAASAPPAPVANPVAPAVDAATSPATVLVTVAVGDTLWDLAREHLAATGLAHDDAAVADHLADIVADNADVVADPDLIHAGEQLRLRVPDAPADAPSLAPQDAPAVEVPAAPGAPPPPAVPATPPPATPPPATIAPSTTSPAASSTTTTTVAGAPAAPAPDPPPAVAGPSSDSPAPIGIGEAALLSAGVVALVASRRRLRLRASTPRTRVPSPHPDVIDAERRLRSVDAGERVLRVDVAVRAAAASLIDQGAGIAVVRAGCDGAVELTLTAPAVLPPPWEGAAAAWRVPGSLPVELLADAARTVGAPCVALAQVGVDTDGRDVLVDVEALGVLAIAAPADRADAVVHGLAATLASSVFAEVAHLVGVGVDEHAFLEHRQAQVAPTVDGALELAATLVGATAAARQSTFVLRARHTSGEAWEPAIVLVGSALAGEVTADVGRAATRVGGGLGVVVGGPVAGAPWRLCADGPRWRLEPLDIELVPVGLSAPDVEALHAVLVAADAPLLDEEGGSDPPPAVDDAGDEARADADDDAWTLLVRLVGSVDILDAGGVPAAFERSKALELVAWLAMHRERATRAGARTALWELDVRDATFANVVSEARRAMARLAEPPDGEEWLGRTLTEVLPLHPGVVADADLIRRRLDAARLQPPELAIETLRPAVELVRGAPFAGTGYLWPDAEGITSNLVLLATSATTELAGHYLSMGDIEGVFWATDRGLRVLPGHEELIGLRMRAHACAGDLAGVRHEWESYERVLNADPWSDGEPAAKLVLLRRELLT